MVFGCIWVGRKKNIRILVGGHTHLRKIGRRMCVFGGGGWGWVGLSVGFKLALPTLPRMSVMKFSNSQWFCDSQYIVVMQLSFAPFQFYNPGYVKVPELNSVHRYAPCG